MVSYAPMFEIFRLEAENRLQRVKLDSIDRESSVESDYGDFITVISNFPILRVFKFVLN